MTARTANAFLLSATIHALFAAALLYTAYSMKDGVIGKAKEFIIVAGPGDNYAATVAPSLGTPEGKGIQIEMPPGPPTPTPAITPPSVDPIVTAPPEPAPVQAVPPPKVEPKSVAKPEPSPVKAAEVKPTTKVDTVPNPAKTFNRKTNAIAWRQKVQREKEAKEAARQAALAAKNADIAAKKAALLAQSKGGGGQSKIAKIDAEGIAKGVLGGSTANKTGGAGGTALSREEQDLLGTYIALLKQHFREAHEKPTGLSDLLAAKVEFFVAADGSISKVSITQSSGNAEFDQSVLAAIRNARTIGPRPDGKSSMLSTRFKMKDED
ncbi:MAG: TonB family protein [Verrucomicrobia bacterium]|nr:TonB family protein [Verrucomicrobiota bacterium]